MSPEGYLSRDTFMRDEYVSLREEIRETKGRIFQLAGFGLVALPSAYGLAQAMEIDALVLSLPVLICTIQLVYLSESRSLMRAGQYIKNNIESNLGGCEDGVCRGWEHWLAEIPTDGSDRRIVDKLLAFFFYLLFAFYYIASVQLACNTGFERWGVVGLAVVLGLYIAIGVGFVFFLATNFRQATSTRA